MNEKYPPPLIVQEWPLITGNPKNRVLVRRRTAALKNLDRYHRYLDMITALVKPCLIGDGGLLEVACGTGFLLLELARLGCKTTGLEIDPDLCELMNEAVSHFDLDTNVICADACAIPLETGSLDAVLSRSFFEHVYDVDLALKEQARILRPGGRLIIHDGNLWNPLSLVHLLLLRPIRTRGRRGGLKWLFTKGRLHKNLYGYLPLGRDEDIKTPRWWRHKLAAFDSLELITATTTGHFTSPHWPRFLHLFIGGCLIVAQKKGRRNKTHHQVSDPISHLRA